MYSIDGQNFVCRNGKNRYGRPLYGQPGIFFTYAGDGPEWALSRPGKTGNLLIGIVRGKQRKWLINADHIVAKYCPGTYVHEVSDALLGKAKIVIHSVGMHAADGVLLKIDVTAKVKDLKMIWAFGGVREIESCDPIDFDTCVYTDAAHFFPKPEDSQGNSIVVDDKGFVLTVPFPLGSPVQSPEVMATGKLYRKMYAGVSGAVALPGNTTGKAKSPVPRIVNARVMIDPMDVSSKAGDTPAVMGHWTPVPGKPAFVGAMMMSKRSHRLKAASLADRFAAAQEHHEQIRNQIKVTTPDPDLNAVVPALCASMDVQWDPPYIVHGGIHCHTPYLAWRHTYGATAFGWFDRAESHFCAFAATQHKKTPPGCDKPRAEAESGLSRPLKQSIIHSRGFIWGHRDDPMIYNMQECFVDMLLRQILYSGDLEFARDMYPVIELHLEWEKRCFDRGGLYENFANTHISDSHQYNGAGGAQASAYTYYANRMMARLAKVFGKDGRKFSKEATRIKRAMDRELWMKAHGSYAECRDILGLRRRNESPELPSIYHPIDSEVTDMFQAYEMIQYTEDTLEQVICGKERGHMVWSSNWVPWFWSTRQLMLNENSHLALAAWQAGCPREAYDHFLGAVLNSMVETRCPAGCIGTSPLDTHHPALATDFACGTGITCRSLIEGLFGVRPNLLDNEILVRPGFPEDWKFATLETPFCNYDYRKNGKTTSITCTLRQKAALKLEIPYAFDEAPDVIVNGRAARGRLTASIGTPFLTIKTRPGIEFHCEIHARGKPVPAVTYERVAIAGGKLRCNFKSLKIKALHDTQGCIAKRKENALTVIRQPGRHTFFAKLQQNAVSWWMPFNIDIRPPVELLHAEYCRHKNVVHGILRNNLNGRERATAIGIEAPRAPGTYPVRQDVRHNNRRYTAESRVPAWTLPDKPGPDAYGTIDISAHVNLDIEAIFRQEYLAPRSPHCSLALPTTGYGEWCGGSKREPPKLDSLYFARRVDHQKRFITPQGVPFYSPNQKGNNALILTQWDNFPARVSIPVSGVRTGRLYFLVAGTANAMYSQMDVARLVVTFADRSKHELALHSPDNFWPIWDDFDTAADAFCLPENPPQRVLIGAGTWANLLDMKVPRKPIRGIEFECLANETIVGLLGISFWTG